MKKFPVSQAVVNRRQVNNNHLFMMMLAAFSLVVFAFGCQKTTPAGGTAGQASGVSSGSAKNAETKIQELDKAIEQTKNNITMDANTKQMTITAMEDAKAKLIAEKK